jgi:hypothetical protein
VSRALVDLDFEVRLVTATDSSTHGWRDVGRGTDIAGQLERLAMLNLTRREQLSTEWVDESQHGGMIMAVLGHLQSGDRQLLAGLAAAGATAYAIVLDVSTWERGGRNAGTPDPPATAWLRAHGWKATTLERDTPLPAAWQGLSR